MYIDVYKCVCVSLTNCIMYYLYVLTMYICLLFLCTSPFVMGINSFIHHKHFIYICFNTYVQQGKTMDNKFYIYVKTLTSLAIWGPGGGGGGGGLQ